MWIISYLRIIVVAVVLTGLVPEATAQPTSTKLKLLSPGGGESFQPGDTVTVAWSGIGTTQYRALRGHDSVVVELSADGGGGWQPLSPLRPWPDTTWKWIVPNIRCTGCLLRVRQVSGNFGSGDLVDSTMISGFGELGLQLFTISMGTTGNLLVAQTNSRLYVVDLNQRTLLHTLAVPDSTWEFANIRFARNDSFLVAGADSTGLTTGLAGIDSSTISLWNTYTGELVSGLRGRFRYFRLAELLNYDRSGAMHPTLPYVVVAGMNDNPVVWDLETRSIIDTIPLQPLDSARNFPALTAEYSPDGSSIAFGSASDVWMWDVESRSPRFRKSFATGPIWFSGDGRYVLTGRRIVDVSSGDVVSTAPYSAGIHRLAAEKTRMQSGRIVYDFSSLDRLQWYEVDKFSSARWGGYALHPGGDTFVELDESGKLYRIDISGQPIAVTERPFSISGILPVVVSQFVGSVEKGSSRDTLIEGFMINGGTAPVSIQDVSITGENKDDFSIVTGGGPYVLESGQTGSISIRFSPSDTGLRRAMFLVRTDLGDVEAQLFGIGVEKTTGVWEAERRTGASDLTMSVQPNPVSDEVHVLLGTPRGTSLELSVYNTVGVLIDRTSLGMVEAGEHAFRYDVSYLRAGVYRVVLRSEDGTVGTMLHIMR